MVPVPTRPEDIKQGQRPNQPQHSPDKPHYPSAPIITATDAPKANPIHASHVVINSQSHNFPNVMIFSVSHSHRIGSEGGSSAQPREPRSACGCKRATPSTRPATGGKLYQPAGCQPADSGSTGCPPRRTHKTVGHKHSCAGWGDCR